MRVGSVVMLSVGMANITPRWNDQVYLLDPCKGTVIEVELNDDYSNQCVVAAKVRWSDGRIVRYGQDCDKELFTYDDLIDVTPQLYVNVYLHDQSYGGSEEGGWWYDTYEPVEQFLCSSEEEAAELYEKKTAEMQEANEGRPSIYHTNSEGRYVVWQEAWPMQYHPAYRPQYC